MKIEIDIRRTLYWSGDFEYEVAREKQIGDWTIRTGCFAICAEAVALLGLTSNLSKIIATTEKRVGAFKVTLGYGRTRIKGKTFPNGSLLDSAGDISDTWWVTFK